MSNFIWNTFAVAAMAGIFAGCVIVVTAGTRMLEGMVARRRGKAGE